MTLEAVNALRSLVDLAVNFLDSWTIPLLTMTPWDLMVYILIFNVILWLLRHLFDWQIGKTAPTRNSFRKVNRGK